MKKVFIFFTILLFPAWLFAQQNTVTGTVRGEDGTALPGVTVVVKNTDQGTATNNNGYYEISAGQNDVLVFSFIGFQTKEVPVSGQKTINVTLSASQKELSQVVVTALGISRQKRELGYASQEISGKVLTSSHQPSLINALQGRAAGVTVSSTGGGPGQGSSILIRGVNSLDPTKNNQPLFVIDGIPIDNSTFTTGSDASGTNPATGVQMPDRVSDINPEDIASVNILRGGAATALYGLRGANGVVVITTKSGQAGRLRVNYTATYSIDHVNKLPEVQDIYTQGYGGVYNPADFWPEWGPTVAEARKIDPSHPAELFNQYGRAYVQGNQFRNTLSFSGGTEKATFSSSLGYDEQNGVLPFTWYQDITARLKGKLNFSKQFQMSASLYYTNTDGNFYSADRFNEEMSYWSPRWDVRDYLKPDGTQKTYGNGNAWYKAATNKFYDRVNRVIGSMDFNYKPIEWFSINYRIGMDYYMDARTAHAPGPKGVPDEIIDEDNGAGFIHEYRLAYRQVNSNLMLTFDHKWNDKLRTTLRIGHDLLDRNIDRVSAEGDTLAYYNVYALWNASHVAIDQYKEKYRIIGLYGQFTLGYDDYLYLTLTGRNDWTSTLSKNNRSFFYPSASVSYIFSENIKNMPKWLTSGKLRASLAGIGKDADPYSTSNVFVKAFNQPVNGVVGFTRSDTKGFPTLKPERTTTFEAGTDLSFLNDRLGLHFTWYTSHSKDMIIPVLTPPTSGYTKVYLNAGEIRNRGVEITVNATPVHSQNFQWDMSLNFSANRNKVLSIFPGLDAIVVGSQFGYAGATVTMKYVAGQSVGDIYGTYWKRYYGSGKAGPLHIDRNRPMVIDNSDPEDSTHYGFPVVGDGQKILGNSYPKWTGGFSNSFSWKNWNLSFLVDTRQGLRKYDQLNNFMAAFGIAEYTENRNETIVFPGVYEDGTKNTIPGWLGQGKKEPDGGDYGAGYYRNIYRGVSENFVEDASWIRLRSASLTYTFPKKWLGETFISNASLSLTGYNLILITDYIGFDPETSSSPAGSNANGWAGFTYPAIRSYMATINVTF